MGLRGKKKSGEISVTLAEEKVPRLRSVGRAGEGGFTRRSTRVGELDFLIFHKVRGSRPVVIPTVNNDSAQSVRVST